MAANEENGSSNARPSATAAQQPIHLRLLDVARAAKAAYDEGRLSAQNGGICSYRWNAFPCAVGAYLDDETAKVWDLGEALFHVKSTDVLALHWAGVFTTDDIEGLSRLQKAHDSWATRPDAGPASFLDVLNTILTNARSVEA